MKKLFFTFILLAFCLPIFGQNKGTVLNAGQVLKPGEYLQDGTCKYRLYMQYDGNLALYGSVLLWQSGTKGSNNWAVVQADGNFVIYDQNNVARWNTSSFGGSSTFLALQPDGNLVLYCSAGVKWATYTTNDIGGSFDNISDKEINVLNYGALPFDNPNYGPQNRAAIQKAVDDAYSKQINIVYIPQGTYWLSEGIHVPRGITIRGASRNSTKIKCNGANVGWIAFDLYSTDIPDSWGCNGNNTFQDISIIGGYNTQGSGVAIRVRNGNKITVKDVFIQGFPGVGIHFKNTGYTLVDNVVIRDVGQDGIWLESDNPNSACTTTNIKNSYFAGCYRSGVHINNGMLITIDNCQFEGNGQGNQGMPTSYIGNAGAILIDGIANRNIRISSNDFEFNKSPYSISMGNASGSEFLFYGNYFDDVSLPYQANLAINSLSNFAYYSNRRLPNKLP